MKMSSVGQEFDQKALEYESNRLANWYQAHAQEVAKHCPVFEQGDILDIGCATGYQLRLLAQKYPDANLVGIDLSAKMIQQAQLLCSDLNQFQFVTDNWEKLSESSIKFLDSFSFKLIICANAYHYFIDPRQAIKKMYEQLDPGGMLLILEREKSNSLLTSIWGFLHRHFIKDQVEFYSANDISQLLMQVGFEQTQLASTIRKYFWKGKLFTSIALIKGEK